MLVNKLDVDMSIRELHLAPWLLLDTFDRA